MHNIRPVTSDELMNVYPEYYKQFAMIYNTSIFRRISESLLNRGLVDLKVWASFDRTYQDSIDAVRACMEEDSPVSLMAMTDRENPVAYFRMQNHSHNDALYCAIAEICLVGPGPIEERNTAVKELYARVINEIEAFILATQKDTEAITFETPRNNANYIDALEDLGYAYVPQPKKRKYYTELFEKFVRTEKKSR